MYCTRLRTRANSIFPPSERTNFSEDHCNRSKLARDGIVEVVSENIEASQELMRRKYNHGSKEAEVKSGDWIWLRKESRTYTLSPMFEGPWLVLKKRGVNVHLSDADGHHRAVIHLIDVRKLLIPLV